MARSPKCRQPVVGNTRNDMYLTSEALRFLAKDKEADLSAADVKTLSTFKKELDSSTKFIPTWVRSRSPLRSDSAP